MATKSLQSILLWIHRWFGIILGLHFMIMGLTGCYLLFGTGFENLLHPSLRLTKGNVESYDLARVVEAGIVGMNSKVYPSRIAFPEGINENAILSFNVASEGEESRTLQAFIDPGDLSFKGKQDPDDTLREFLFRYHNKLFLDGEIGEPLIAVGGCLLLVLLLSGLYLWWPKKRFLKRALKLPKFKTLYQYLYDLHKTLGLYGLALLLMMVSTGIYIAQPHWFESRKEEKKEIPEAVSKPEVKRIKDLPVTIAIDFAKLQNDLIQLKVPGRRLLMAVKADKMLIELRSIVRGEEEQRFTYDINTSQLSRVEKEQRPFVLRPFLHDLHEGKFWSWTGRYIVLMATPFTVFLFISGLWIWWKRPSRRRRI